MQQNKNIEKENEDSNNKISLLKVMATFLGLISVLFMSSMLIESSNYFIGGTILFITGLLLQFFIRNIDKNHFLFKISNLSVLYLLAVGLFVGTLNIMNGIMDEYGMVLPIKFIEIPALLLSLYFYFKYKNNYILFTSFLIFNLMTFVSLSLLLEDTNYMYSIGENSPLVLSYLSIVIFLSLKYSNKLISPARKTYNALILIYNLIGALFYLDIHHDEKNLYFVASIIISNLILIAINIKYEEKYLNKLLVTVSVIWLFMPLILKFFG